MKKLRAFSLIEIMIVLGIITMILGLTTTYLFNFKSGSALKISANNLMAALNQARSLAITQQLEHQVVLDIADSKYSVYSKDGLNRQQIIVWTKLSDGVIITSTTLPIDSQLSKPAEVFNPNGSAESNASIYLQNSAGEEYTITIINVTGRVKIYNYKKL